MKVLWSVNFPINSTKYFVERGYATNCLVEREHHFELNKMFYEVWPLNKKTEPLNTRKTRKEEEQFSVFRVFRG